VKTLFTNPLQGMAVAPWNPGYTVRSRMRDALAADEWFLVATTESSVSEMRGYFGDSFQNAKFCDRFRNSEKNFHEFRVVSADFYAKNVALQCREARAVKPEIIIETEITYGVSTSYLLLVLTLKKNRRGIVRSIWVRMSRSASGTLVMFGARMASGSSETAYRRFPHIACIT
jgi:hypothetical protein